MRILYYYTSYERWPAVRERGKVPVDELTTHADRPLDDDTGLRVAVELPNRWPRKRPVPVGPWVDAIDRPDGATLWDEHNLRPCGVSRWALIEPPPGA
jgi:hypothetical protein